MNLFFCNEGFCNFEYKLKILCEYFKYIEDESMRLLAI